MKKVLFPKWIQITDLKTLPETIFWQRLANVSKLPRIVRQQVAIQLRDPGLSTQDLFSWGTRLRAFARTWGLTFIVNDRLDLAVLLKAHGIHLGRSSVPIHEARPFVGNHVWFFGSAHSEDEVQSNIENGFDASLLSPIFSSPGKSNKLGLKAIQNVQTWDEPLKKSHYIYALGGVDQNNAKKCIQAGAFGLATLRGDLSNCIHLSENPTP